MSAPLLVCLSLALLLPCAAAAAVLSADGFEFRVEPAGDRLLHLHIAARTHGYVGLGFSLDGRLSSSDVVIAWVQDDTPKVFDGHGLEGRSAPEKDHSQNYKILEGFQNDTHTVIKLERPWDTCDRKGDLVFVNDTMRLIWTVSEHNPSPFGWGVIEWSGPKSILISSSRNQTNNEDNRYWDVIAQDFTLPRDSPSFHWCKIYKVPALSRKHHIIGYSPIIEEGHSALIAKMVLYECLGGSKFEIFGSHPGSACRDSRMPEEWSACHTPVVVWATGAQGQIFPEHIGLPMAEGEGKSTYFMLEIHYDNPALQRVRDNSGLRLYYSEELRQYDSSILATGITPTGAHIIPPKQSRFTTRGYCDNQCTNLMFPEKGIKIVAVSFHTHSAGRQVRLRQIREGKEIQVIAQDRYFDPGYQQAKQLISEVTVLPGDDLVTECSYSTLNRTAPTLGGHAVKEEACMAYIQYYPRTALASCTSMTEAEFFFQTFGVEEFYNQKMDEVEKIMLKLSEKQPQKNHKKKPMQSLLFRFSEMQGFNLDNKNPYIHVDPSGDEEGIFSELVINKPEEFRNKSFMSHLRELPWSEKLFTQQVEEILNKGKFRTFCRLQDSTPAMPSSIYSFPNVTVINETRHISYCRKERSGDFSDSSSASLSYTSKYLLSLLNILLMFFVL